MGDVKNLSSTEANEKIKELAEDIKTCMFCTYKGDNLQARPMSTQLVDAAGNIWFLSDRNSNKNQEIKSNNKVDLTYAHGQDKFLSIHGHAYISLDKAKIKELWDPIAKIWFKDGVDDPNVSVIKVEVKDGYYWNNKHGKMMAFAKMATSLITGATMDDGIEGKLKK